MILIIKDYSYHFDYFVRWDKLWRNPQINPVHNNLYACSISICSFVESGLGSLDIWVWQAQLIHLSFEIIIHEQTYSIKILDLWKLIVALHVVTTQRHLFLYYFIDKVFVVFFFIIFLFKELLTEISFFPPDLTFQKFAVIF